MQPLAIALHIILACRPASAQVGPVDRWGDVSEGAWVKAHVTYEAGAKKQEQDTTRTVSEVRIWRGLVWMNWRTPGKKPGRGSLEGCGILRLHDCAALPFGHPKATTGFTSCFLKRRAGITS